MPPKTGRRAPEVPHLTMPARETRARTALDSENARHGMTHVGAHTPQHQQGNVRIMAETMGADGFTPTGLPHVTGGQQPPSGNNSVGDHDHLTRLVPLGLHTNGQALFRRENVSLDDTGVTQHRLVTVDSAPTFVTRGARTGQPRHNVHDVQSDGSTTPSGEWPLSPRTAANVLQRAAVIHQQQTVPPVVARGRRQ